MVWVGLVAAYVGKWLRARPAALAALAHPVQSGFVPLLPLTTMLMALAVAPRAHPRALGLWVAGVAGQLAFGAALNARLWQGGREPEATTTVLHLPTVGVNFVAATVAGSLGHALFRHRRLCVAGAGVAPPAEARAFDAIASGDARHAGHQLAPPLVGAMAYLGITSGPPDLFAQALFGYGLFQVLSLLRLLPLFVVANLFIAWLVVRTLILVRRGQLLPAAGAGPAVAEQEHRPRRDDGSSERPAAPP